MALEMPLRVDLAKKAISNESKGIDKEQVIKSGIEENFKKIHRCLESHLLEYSLQKFTRYSLQFSLKNVQVDLLLSPYWERKEDYFDYLEYLQRSGQKDKLEMFSSSASKWQVEFVKEQPPEAIDYIRRAKAWRKETKEINSVTKSYLIVLLVIKAYENVQERGKLVTSELLQNEIVLLVKNVHLEIYWTYHYDLERIRKFHHLPPYIIDPANPCNNVYESGLKNNSGSGIIDSWCTIHRLIPTLDLTLPLKTDESSFQHESVITSPWKQTHFAPSVPTLTGLGVLGGKKHKRRKRRKRNNMIKIEVWFHLPILNKKYSEDRKRFIARQPEVVQSYIKHMKAWRHVQWDENGITFGRPSAYLLSVLVIKAYQISIDKTPESITKELSGLIRNGKHRVVCFNDMYYAPPYVADPVNPSNNLQNRNNEKASWKS